MISIFVNIVANYKYCCCLAKQKQKPRAHYLNEFSSIVFMLLTGVLLSGLMCPMLHDGMESIRTQVNSYLSQFVLILVISYSVFGQFVLILLNLVNSYLFWSIRTQFGQFVLIPKI